MFKHLIDIKNLDKQDILNLIRKAELFKSGELHSSSAGKTVAMMFLENSTRTKCSFELAAKKLGLHVLNFETSKSSFSKGESLLDTLNNLYFIGVEAVVIRSGENGLLENTASRLKYPLKLINAGEGNMSHPTQALLDFMTMTEKLGDIKGKRIAIAGDIKHSRVAKSNLELLGKFGAKVKLCAPDYFKDESIKNVTWYNNLAGAITAADVVMMLRVQRERHEQTDYSFEDYVRDFGLTSEKLEKYAPDAVLMHPGPVNRDVEISSELLDGEKGLTILEQARNGAYIRMAALDEILSEGAK
ncbi:MAG: aspartate carbamoyltransferase catalytic subunit [Heliobacteriaceae bacterium]|nr:aspartate carbamoyltransferase catalytic subunit [Heliobacteriaceae bacterium]